jgi:hypothetical protein
MPPSDFATADVGAVLDALTLEESIALVAGVGFWHTAAVPHLGVPALKVRPASVRPVPYVPSCVIRALTQTLVARARAGQRRAEWCVVRGVVSAGSGC